MNAFIFNKLLMKSSLESPEILPSESWDCTFHYTYGKTYTS